ncbi:hypothetical protein [Halogeometricum sp. CBA1124]|uniref:hypothetical protein n=1 Tax=Halogeometricum sp. CBA1124 TaxID=2668071 RepID=UPI00142AD370|nr:hypothetical protein [Halogeometricum sp. CBA1124]MUV59136.1 hypothetical protein [Halogeometricum sp. CBA1124]
MPHDAVGDASVRRTTRSTPDSKNGTVFRIPRRPPANPPDCITCSTSRTVSAASTRVAVTVASGGCSPSPYRGDVTVTVAPSRSAVTSAVGSTDAGAASISTSAPVASVSSP